MRDQRQFIGGGALLVPVDESTPFFPAIYNEDWLFLLGELADGGRLGEGGDVHQTPYDGYAPNRVRAEELGDILGEGTLSLCVAAGEPHYANKLFDRVEKPEYWERVIKGRRSLCNMLMSLAQEISHPHQSRVRRALSVAKDVLGEIARDEPFWTHQLASYWSTWQHDLEQWRMWLAPRTDKQRRVEIRAEVSDSQWFVVVRHPALEQLLLAPDPSH